MLVVDDDPMIRRSLQRVLGADGRLVVQEAEDGLAALRILESQHVDILISDESMPEINGVRLLQTVRSRWPGTRRVLYTGHPHADVVLDAINRGGVDKALMKGIPIEQLRMELGELVAECFEQAVGAPAADTVPTILAEAVRSDHGRPNVLVLAVELAVATSFEASLRAHGFEVRTAQSAEDALRELELERADTIVLDLGGPGLDAGGFLRRLRGFDLDCPVVVTTARGEVSRALDAVRDGAYRYLVHPVRGEALTAVVRQAALLRRVAELRRRALVEADEQAAWQVGDRAALEVRFRHALDQLFMVYQPIVSWSERRVIGYEALVRSAEPTLPHPGALFDAAARLERLDELSRRIRHLSPQPFGGLPRHGAADPLLFMNVHVSDLDADDFIEGPLASLAPFVALEITERAALDSLDRVVPRVSELRARGYRVAVDDLGAGYAGLTSFALLEPHIVKIDMSLVRDIHRTPTKQRLVAGLTEACKDLGVWLIAEGVETTEEREVLVKLGCELFQGFLFARPARGLPQPSWD
ncbi:MAG: EAL domain-containing response regulator [Sandaracinaceae bacterium]|nr:EAL domain-containing response regulator [Sandaracinaceae bacterium]